MLEVGVADMVERQVEEEGFGGDGEQGRGEGDHAGVVVGLEEGPIDHELLQPIR